MSNMVELYSITTFGKCKKCGVVHSIGEGNAKKYCFDLMHDLEEALSSLQF